VIYDVYDSCTSFLRTTDIYTNRKETPRSMSSTFSLRLHFALHLCHCVGEKVYYTTITKVGLFIMCI
jgi:hypothetical protein